MVRGILIDLDDTLADDRTATQKAVQCLWRSRAEKSNETDVNLSARWLAITDRHWRRFRAGETTLQGQRRCRISELFNQPFSEAEADELFEEYLSHYEENWRLVPEATSFLEATSGLPKVIVTNTEVNQAARKVALLNLSSHFVAVVTPEVAGVPKPKPEIFAHAIRLLGLRASECLMIGDSLEFDITPAKALGMATFHVHSAPGGGLLEAARAT